MAFLLDSGFVYAQINGKDKWHSQVSEAIKIAERETIILPVPAITEIAYLLLHDVGVEAASHFVQGLSNTSLVLENPTAADYARSAEILRKYNDAKIDFVDVCIVAMAERLNIKKILTVDHRHFRLFRPRHCEAFELFPEIP